MVACADISKDIKLIQTTNDKNDVLQSDELDFINNNIHKQVLYCKSPEHLIHNLVLSLGAIAYNNHELDTFYFHNINFDLQFILSALHRLFDIKTVIKDRNFKESFVLSSRSTYFLYTMLI